MSLVSDFLDLLFPRFCYSCQVKLPYSKDVLCDVCLEKLDFLEKICPLCGEIIDNKECTKCDSNHFHFDLARSIYHFDPLIQKIIHEFKYNEMTSIAKLIADLSAKYLSKYTPFPEIDFMVPIPLHRVKKRMRGFNQAELITKYLAVLTNNSHAPKLITRNRFTTTQTLLNRKERKQNVAGAFRINKRYDIQNKTILIVDDVFTTGATVNTISKLLKQNGASKVYVLTFARA